MPLKNVNWLSYLDTVRALFTLQDPKQFRRAGKQFLARLKERTADRDKAISPISYNNRLKAIHQPVLVANGESDRMVPSKDSADLVRRLPNAELVIYPDAGHGGIFQFHEQFVAEALRFLERP